MAIKNTVNAMFANNNATVAGIRTFATEKVAETKAHLNATGEQAIAAALGATRVLLGGRSGPGKAGRQLNATHLSDI